MAKPFSISFWKVGGCVSLPLYILTLGVIRWCEFLMPRPVSYQLEPGNCLWAAGDMLECQDVAFKCWARLPSLTWRECWDAVWPFYPEKLVLAFVVWFVALHLLFPNFGEGPGPLPKGNVS